jgi:hypothetical protein
MEVFMSMHKKETIRFTFDCPTDLHAIAKMKASGLHQSLKDYLVHLVIKDVSENPPKFMDEKAFQKQLNMLLENDYELMKRLKER